MANRWLTPAMLCVACILASPTSFLVGWLLERIPSDRAVAILAQGLFHRQVGASIAGAMRAGGTRHSASFKGCRRVWCPSDEVKQRVLDKLKELFSDMTKSYADKGITWSKKNQQHMKRWNSIVDSIRYDESLGLNSRGGARHLGEHDGSDEDAGEEHDGRNEDAGEEYPQRIQFLLTMLCQASTSLQLFTTGFGADGMTQRILDLTQTDQLMFLAGFGGACSFVRVLACRYAQMIGFAAGGLCQLGSGGWRTAWELLGAKEERTTWTHPPVNVIVPVLLCFLPILVGIVESHLPGWGVLVTYQTVQALLCETRKYRWGGVRRRPGNRLDFYMDLLTIFAADWGLSLAPAARRCKRLVKLRFPGLDVDLAIAAEMVDLFEAMVVRFCVQRLKLQRTCILEGAQRIYTSEKFAILRFCMFTYQLDLGSLAIWQYSLRTSCDYLRGAPGSAALHDASWRGGGSIQRQPSTLNRSVAEFLTDLMACVTLLADGKVRTEIGPLRDVASLHEKLRDVRVTWPYGRACDWKELRGSSMAIWSDLE